MRRLNAFRGISIAAFCLLLSGCPGGVRVNLFNAMNANIKVIHDYKENLFTEIGVGESGKFVQRTSCLWIRVGGDLVGYQMLAFPDKYVSNKNLNPLVSMKIDRNADVYVVPANDGDLDLGMKLAKGCKSKQK